MKKYITVFLATIAMAVLCGCNRQMVDLTYSYDYAQIKMPDGTIIEGKLNSWRDYDGRKILLTRTPGRQRALSAVR